MIGGLLLMLAVALPAIGAVNHEGKKIALADLPPMLQAAASVSIGKDVAEFHVKEAPEGYRAVNGAHKLSVTFLPDGAVVSSNSDSWSLTLTAFGREASTAPVQKADIMADANQVKYRRGVLTEWYVNGPLGLEQGFTINSRPAGSSEKLLVIQLTGSGLRSVPAGDGVLSLVRHDNSEAFRYGGLAAWDVDGRSLPVQLTLADQQVMLQVDDREARYPVVVDPFYQQSILAPSDPVTGDDFGAKAAISGDGSTALIASDGKAIGANNGQGAVYVFIRSGGVWSQQARLTASDGALGSHFGSSVALSVDGSMALVGASGAEAAYVFTRTGATWTQISKLTASDVSTGWFGSSVALSRDTTTALVGAYYKTIGANTYQGAAYVFTRSGTTWSQEAKLISADGVANDNFGYSVALAGDGSTALVGALYKTIGANTRQGAAYTFTRSGTSWTQQAQMTASNGAAYDYFGMSVALSNDGSTALIGAYNNSVYGSAFVYTRSASVWTQQARLAPSYTDSPMYFGNSVALSSDGMTALVGSFYSSVGSISQAGTAYCFTNSSGIWSQQSKLTASDMVAGDEFGYSVALSDDGLNAVVGAPRRNSITGTAYAFTRNMAIFLAGPSFVVYGQDVWLTISSKGDGGSTASGTVTFRDGSDVIATTPMTNGSAFSTVVFSTLGLHTITAEFVGAGHPTLSATLGVTVDKAFTSTSMSTAPNPSQSGQMVTVSFAVTGTGILPTTGKVTVGDGTLIYCSATPVANQGTCQIYLHSPGLISLMATYAGDNDSLTSMSGPSFQTVTAAPAPAAAALVKPMGLDLGKVAVNSASVPQRVVVANTGNLAMSISSISSDACFQQTNNCPPSLGVGSTCEVTVTFTPLVSGATNGKLTITDSAPGSPHQVNVNGTGLLVAESIVIDPSNNQNLYSGIDGAGIYKSANAGAGWKAATTQPSNTRVKAVVITSTDVTKLYAATYGGGIFKSIDSGDTWTVCANTNLANLNVVSLTTDAAGKLYAGTEAGIFVSNDGCSNWTAMNSGLPN